MSVLFYYPGIIRIFQKNKSCQRRDTNYYCERVGGEPSAFRAYETLDDLNWTIKYAGENVLIAYTPGKWDHTGEEITVKTNNNELTVTSKRMANGESFDITGKNKRHLEDFLTVFENVKAPREDLLAKWQEKITSA